jgi:Fe-S-cluster formation regulator IscX/YfhJ/predicted Fe-Mo cluster-binding NifX family protein
MGFDQSHRSAQLHVTEGPMQREASVQRRGGSGSRATKRAALRHEERMAPHGFAAAESLAHRAAAEFQPPLWLRRLALQLKLEPGQLLGIASAVVLLMAIIWSLIARFDVKHDKMNLHADPSIIAGQRGAFHPAGPPATDDFDQTGLHATANPWPTHLPKTASEAIKDTIQAGGDLLGRSVHAVEHVWDRATDGAHHGAEDLAGLGEDIALRARGSFDGVKHRAHHAADDASHVARDIQDRGEHLAHRARDTAEHVKDFGVDRMAPSHVGRRAHGVFDDAKDAVEGMANDVQHEVQHNVRDAWAEARHIGEDLRHRAHDAVHPRPESFFTTIKDKIMGVPEPRATINDAKQRVEHAWDRAADGANNIAGDIQDRGEHLAHRAHDAAEHMKDFGIERMAPSHLGRRAHGVFDDAKDAVEGMANDVQHEVQHNAHKAWEGARETASEFGDRVHDAVHPKPKSFFTTIKDKVMGVPEPRATINDAKQRVEHAWDRAADGASNIAGDIQDSGEHLAHRAHDAAEHVKDFGIERMTATPLSHHAHGAFDDAKDAVEGMANDVQHNAHKAWEGARETASEIGDRVHDAVHPKPKSFFTIIKDAVMGVPEPRATIDAAKQRVDHAWHRAGEAAGDIQDRGEHLAHRAHDAAEHVKDFGIDRVH